MNTSEKSKFVAILFCDIQGYTQLMHQDGGKATSLVSHFQNQLEIHTAKFKGTIVNFYGDGALCTFPTPISAVRCAISLQKAFSQDPITPVRMGIHSGTVTMEGGKVFGDSVNISSRIESMGVPHSVLISKQVRDDIKNHPDLDLRSLGQFEFKNLDDSIEVFAISDGELIVPSRSDLKGKFKERSKGKFAKNLNPITLIILIGVLGISLWQGLKSDAKHDNLSTKKFTSLAVFPFSFPAEDVSLKYLSEGIPESLINFLSNNSDLRVVSRYSSFPLKDSLHNISLIQKMLKVDAILVGNIEPKGEILNFDTELISTKNQTRLWGDQLAGNANDLEEIEKKISASIINLFSDPGTSQNQERTVKPEAYKHYMQGRHLSFGVTPEEINLSVDHFHKAIEIDPDFARAYAALANQKFAQARFSNTTRQEMIREAKLAINNAKRLDPDLADAHLAEANIKFYCDFDWQGADQSFRKALSGDPDNSQILSDFAFFQCAMNNYEEAVKLAEKAIELDPVSISTMHIIAWAHLYKNPEKSIDEFNQMTQIHPLWIWGHFKKGFAQVLSGQCEEALATFEEVESRKGEWGGELLESYLSVMYKKCGKDELSADKKNFVIEHFTRNGISDPLNIAVLYGGTGDLDQMMSYAYQCVDEKSTNVALMQLIKDLHAFHKDPFAHPEYISLLKTLNFPNN